MEKQILYKVDIQGNEAALSEMAKLRKSNAELKRENDEYNKSLKDGKAVSDEMAKSYERNNAQIKANNKAINQLTKEVTSNGNQQTNLRKQLTDVRKEMQSMAAAGDTQSKQYKELRDQAAGYQDTLDRVNREIKTFADDAMVINTVVDTTKGLASGMQLVQSVTALAGVENEKLMEVLVRLQAVQGVVNGLQGVQNMLLKESRVVILAKVAAARIATTAQWAWNAAMTANPIGIIIGLVAGLIAGIVALVRNFDAVTDAIKRAWEFLTFWRNSSEEAADSTDRLTESNERFNKSAERKADKLEFEIRLMKALGVEQDEIIEKERQLLQLKIRQTEISLQAAEAAGFLGRKQAEELRERLRGYQQDLEVFEATQTRKARLEEERLNREAQRREEAQLKQAEDDLRRAELATAELRLLLEDSLDNRINLEEVKFRQSLETKKNITEEELELLRVKHELELEAIRERYEQEEELASEFGDDEEGRKNKLSTYEEYLEQRRQSELTDFERRAEQYKEWLDAKAISDVEYTNLVKQLNEEIAESDRQLAEERAKAALATSRSLIDSMVKTGNAASGFAEFAKMLAAAEASINIITGVAKTASVGFPQNIPLLLGYAAQTAGLVNQIKGTKTPSAPKLAKGGAILSGKSHNQGGIKFYSDHGHEFEMEGNEYFAIVNKYDAERAAMLDSVNQRHGVAFGSSSGNYFARGGASMPLPRRDFRQNDVEQIIEQTIKSVISIPVTVVERDIRDTSRRVQVLESAGDL